MLVFAAIAVAIAIYFALQPTPPDPTVHQLEKQLHQQDSIIRVQQEIRVGLDLAMKQRQTTIDAQTKQIEQSKREIVMIKKHYENQIRNIKSMSTNQLDSFFTARYGQ